MNLPNALTVLRIFLVPVLVVVLLTRTRTTAACCWASPIFGLAVLTDYLDGYFARRRNQVTRLGILLDPLADKLLTAAAFLSLVEMDAVPGVDGDDHPGPGVRGHRPAQRGRGARLPDPGLGAGEGEDGRAGGRDLPAPARRASTRSCRLPGLAALWLVVVLALVSGIDYFRTFWREVYRPGPRAVPREAEPLVRAEQGPAEVDPAGPESRPSAARPGPRS